jgi:hypothetical protein
MRAAKRIPCAFDAKWTFRISGWNKKLQTTEKGLKFPKMYEQIEGLTTTESNLPKIQKNALEEMQGWASKK